MTLLALWSVAYVAAGVIVAVLFITTDRAAAREVRAESFGADFVGFLIVVLALWPLFGPVFVAITVARWILESRARAAAAAALAKPAAGDELV